MKIIQGAKVHLAETMQRLPDVFPVYSVRTKCGVDAKGAVYPDDTDFDAVTKCEACHAN